MILAGICKLMGDLCGFVAPLCLNQIVRYLQHPEMAWWNPPYFGYLMASILFITTVLQSIFLHQVH